MKEEIWKDVIGFEGYYQVSNLGRVKGLSRYKTMWHGGETNKPECILKQDKSKRGYLTVRFHAAKLGIRNKFVSVHRLMMIHFCHNPENKKYINHINGIKDDNRLENLEWCTASENTIHAHNTGLCNNHVHGSRSHFSKLTNKVVINIRKMNDEGYTISEIAKKYKITNSNVRYIVTGHTWKHLLNKETKLVRQ